MSYSTSRWIKRVEEVRERAGIEPDRAVAEQVVANPGQLGHDRTDVLAARRELDAQQPFDRAVPGHVVGQRRDVVHPVGDRDVLVVVQVLADLLEARVQIADVGHRVEHPLAVQEQHDPQRGVGGRVLRAEIQRPDVVVRGRPAPLGWAARGGVSRDRFGRGHDSNLQSFGRHARCVPTRSVSSSPAGGPESCVVRPALASGSPCGAERK